MNTRCNEKQPPVAPSVLLPAVPQPVLAQTLVLLHRLMFPDKGLCSFLPQDRNGTAIKYATLFSRFGGAACASIFPPFLEALFVINRNGLHARLALEILKFDF